MTSPSKDNASDFVSKVTFSPVSDSTGNQALIVTIKSVTPKAEDLSKIMEKPRRSLSFDAKKTTSDVKRKTRSRTSGNTKSTMTEQHQEVSSATQTSVTIPGSTSSPSVKSVPETSSALKIVPKSPSGTPCLKHAAENISRKASDIETEKVSMCSNCSKSMLSYIFVVQDFLDSLAKEIVGNSDPQNCIQCLRQETRSSMSDREEVTRSDSKQSSKSRAKDVRGSKSEEEPTLGVRKSSTRAKEPSRDVRRYEETSDQLIERSLSQHRQQDNDKCFPTSTIPNLQGVVSNEQQNFRTYSQVSDQQAQSNISSRDEQSSQIRNEGQHETHPGHQGSLQVQPEPYISKTYSEIAEQAQSHIRSRDEQGSHEESRQVRYLGHQDSQQFQADPQGFHLHQTTDHPYSGHDSHSERHDQKGDYSYQSYPDEQTQVPLRRPVNRQRPDFVPYQGQHSEGKVESSVSTPFSDGVDGIVSTLSNAEREVYDDARNGAGWEGLSEAQLVSSSSSPMAHEAYVTMCRNNAEALGCLVLGTSLLLTRTSRTLCVLVSDGVSNAFRGPLSSVFHVVQLARSLDSLGSTKLALLEQPELGVSFEKLNVWRLLHFDKCVFLNPDTLVVQNCDELFCRDELSAVADIGWPDCFNSGVFVFVPSLQTFWQLLEFAEKQGSYDGGDQGLLNSYFNSWSEDINKKLSFIYNLMANVSYTYTPAFKQFGRTVKVVQFHGSSKPWHVKFFSRTGQISPESPVHPTYAQFVHIWINIFRVGALRQLTQDIRSYAQSQEVICAVELLRFFPLPSESEAEFFLTPPSVRLRLAEKRLHRSPSKPGSTDVQRRKSAEFPQRSAVHDVEGASNKRENIERLNAQSGAEKSVIDEVAGKSAIDEVAGTSAIEEDVRKSAFGEVAEKSAIVGEASGVQISETKSGPDDKDSLPGSEVGNYQGMKAWEQGRMDYQGTDSSDTIIKRLQFLMEQPK